MTVEKSALRQLLRERRKGLADAVVAAAGAAVFARLRSFPPYQSAVAVVTYIADESEIPTTSVLEDVTGRGRALYLPRTGSAGGLVPWRLGDPLTAGPGGVLEPSGGAAQCPRCPAIALVPVVAWDAAGRRLGRGGGFYDRVFTTLPQGVTRVGLAYEFQEVAHLPRDPWDVPLHYVITERRLVRCADPEGVGPALVQKGGLRP
jgi:5-formyltetrahydrofolate cyclo-ligase